MSGRPRLSLMAVLALAALAATSGCSPSTQKPARPVEETAAQQQDSQWSRDRLPRILAGLELNATQLAELRALRDDLEVQLEPATEAGRELVLAIAKATKRCDGNSMAIEDAASWAVTVGRQVRGNLLDGIDRLHSILTPKQRQLLARRLLNAQDQRMTEEERAEKGAESLDEAIDLSLGQMLSVIVRGAALQSLLEKELAPWRTRLKRALRAFPDDDFRIREHEVSEAPIVEISMRFVQDAVRTLMPILEQEQCDALGRWIREEMKRQEEERRKREKERETATNPS